MEASPDNWWLSPQFEFGADYEFGEVRLSPSVQLRYALQRADDYREQGGRTAARVLR